MQNFYLKKKKYIIRFVLVSLLIILLQDARFFLSILYYSYEKTVFTKIFRKELYLDIVIPNNSF